MLKPKERQAVLDAAMRGLGPTEISKKLGLTSGQVSGIIQRARRKGLPIKRLRESPGTWGGQKFVQVTIPRETAALYEEVGRRRNVKGSCLIREVLHAVGKDKLFDAVLDE